VGSAKGKIKAELDHSRFGDRLAEISNRFHALTDAQRNKGSRSEPRKNQTEPVGSKIPPIILVMIGLFSLNNHETPAGGQTLNTA